MYRTFVNAFKVKNTYRANSILYYLKCIPLIGKHISNSVYGASYIKEFAMVLSIFVEIMLTFLGKILYVVVLALIATSWNEFISIWNPDATLEMTFLNIYFFLVLAGGWVNCYVLEMKKDNYYSIMLMRMDAKEVAVSQFIYFLIRAYIGNLAVILVAGIFLDLPLAIRLVLPFYIVAIKIIGGSFKIWLYANKKVLENFQKMAVKECLTAMIFFIPALGLVAIGYGITYTGVYIGTVMSVIGAFVAMRYVWTCTAYKRIYRRIMAESEIVVDTKNAQSSQIRKNLGEQIDTVDTTEVRKEGYAYLNEIFVRRHRKMLGRAVRIFAVIELGVVLLMIALIFILPEFKQVVNQGLVKTLPTCLFIMYLTNRGAYIVKAMFLNCDCQMLNFRFYKQPDTILGLFKERLKSIIKLDLGHSIIIAVGMPLLLVLSGGTNRPIEYLMLFLSIVAMSIFFSVHNLVLYYVFQPYNENVEIKNPIYGVINMVVYMVCIGLNMKAIPIETFGTIVIFFSIFYVILALLLAYKLAPKTFKLRH